ncbi:hypothetical protein Mal52_11220 [Symmachiella dynata]|uniref:Uncharacterized protein n=1 Tax=Symmachiella dynata TaxID=2527995 RepID=A0A517ZJI4_9PLAN|nr:hypothetical protein [Symmachiella dynata]QDU42655.1 hypothetical protein Mal52_11220 [Symmachiella dynata]
MPNSRNLLRSLIVFTVLLLILVPAGYFYLRYQNYHSALECTKEWARLNEFPTSATDLNVENVGSLFTREFAVSFVAPLDDTNAWLKESPGTKDVTPEKVGSIWKYDIEPGGGAQHAELEVDQQSGTVTIRAYWS